MKMCNKCKANKDLTEFYIRKNGRAAGNHHHGLKWRYTANGTV